MMSADEVLRAERALSTAFPEPARISVAADPFAGLRISVISPDFADLPQSRRRERVLELVDDHKIAHLKLLTPDEEVLLGEAGPDTPVNVDELPLWPEALVQGQAERVVLNLPSRSFMTLPAPVVATFYSLRGGVGRSTTLAHVAYILAQQGLRVLCI